MRPCLKTKQKRLNTCKGDVGAHPHWRACGAGPDHSTLCEVSCKSSLRTLIVEHFLKRSWKFGHIILVMCHSCGVNLSFSKREVGDGKTPWRFGLRPAVVMLGAGVLCGPILELHLIQ